MKLISNKTRIISFSILLSALLFVLLPISATSDESKQQQHQLSQYDFHRAIEAMQRESGNKLPIGDLMIRIAQDFLGLPYKPGTLEGTPEGPCRMDFSGVDCVTFYETVYAIAYSIKKATPRMINLQDLCKTIEYVRYKKMDYDDNTMYADTLVYSDRLHYASEWIYFNCKRGLFEDITKKIGGEVHKTDVYFMSKNPDKYPAPFSSDPVIQKNIKQNEDFINKQIFYYIPQDKIVTIENQLQNGDLVFITSNYKGLDYNHTGIIYVDEHGVRRLMHASSPKDVHKVIIGDRISDYVNGIKAHSGITILRPLAIK